MNNPHNICKFGDDFFQKHRCVPIENRFCTDSCPLDMDNRNTTLNDIGTGQCFIRGAGQDLTKRVATAHLTIRLKGEQVIKPFLILKNENPSEDRRSAPNLDKREITFMGKPGRESDFYPTDIEIFFDPKAWFSQTMANIYADYFIEKTQPILEKSHTYEYGAGPYIGLQQDGLKLKIM